MAQRYNEEDQDFLCGNSCKHEQVENNLEETILNKEELINSVREAILNTQEILLNIQKVPFIYK